MDGFAPVTAFMPDGAVISESQRVSASQGDRRRLPSLEGVGVIAVNSPNGTPRGSKCGSPSMRKSALASPLSKNRGSRASFSNPALVGAEESGKVRKLQSSISRGKSVTQAELVTAGAVRRLSTGHFNQLYSPGAETAVQQALASASQRGSMAGGDMGGDMGGDILAIAPSESITERMKSYRDLREAHILRQQEKGVSREEAAEGFKGDHGLLRGNEETLEALDIEKEIGTTGQRVVEELQANVKRMQDMSVRLSSLPSTAQWPDSIYTAEHLGEQCGLLEAPATVGVKKEAPLPDPDPFDAKTRLQALGMKSTVRIEDSYKELKASWDKVRNHGLSFELAEVADIPTNAITVLHKAQSLDVGEAWNANQVLLQEAEAAVAETRRILSEAVSKSGEREKRKLQRDRAEDIVQDAIIQVGEVPAEERQWTFRHRRRREREVPFCQNVGKSADALYRKLASQIDRVGEIAHSSWGILEGFAGRIQEVQGEQQKTLADARARVSVIVPRYQELIRNLNEDMQAVEQTLQKARAANEATENRLREMHRGSEELLSANTVKQQLLLAELRALYEERDAEVHRRIEEVHRENKRKKEYNQFVRIAQTHVDAVREAIAMAEDARKWVSAVGVAADACSPDVEKAFVQLNSNIHSHRVESQTRALVALVGANHCRSDLAVHKVHRIDGIERTLDSTNRQAEFSRNTWDPEATEQEGQLIQLWNTLRREAAQVRGCRQVILATQGQVQETTRRLQKLQGAAAVEFLPKFPFEREESTCKEEDKRWDTLERRWGSLADRATSRIVQTASVRRASSQKRILASAGVRLSGTGSVKITRPLPRPPGSASMLAKRLQVADDSDDDESENTALFTKHEGNLLRLPILEGVLF